MDGASIGHPCYEMVMGRQGLPSVKAAPACSQAGLVDGNRRETFINVYLSLVKDTPVLLKVIGKNCRAQQRRNPFGVLLQSANRG